MTNLLSSLSFNIVPQLQGKMRKRRKGRRMKQVMRTQLLKSVLICSKRDLNSLVFKVMVFWKLYGTHPRRPRGGQSGREKRRDKNFQAQAEKPLGTDSHRTISKRSSNRWLLIGHKKMLCIILPNRQTASPEFFSWVRCLVPVRRLSRPSRSMHFGDVSETNGRETPRQSRSAHAWAFLHFWKVHTFNWNNLIYRFSHS